MMKTKKEPVDHSAELRERITRNLARIQALQRDICGGLSQEGEARQEQEGQRGRPPA